MSPDRFPSPYQEMTPAGADGWEQMYSYYHLLGPERQEVDEGRFWFQDALHHPDVLHPYDEIQCECWWPGLGAFNTRIFSMPPAFGVDQRVINGYLYISPVPVDDPDTIPARAEEFAARAGHYYENWDEIYEEWKQKVTTALERIRAIEFAPLPELEDMEVVTSHRGYSTGYAMVRDFGVLIDTMYETYQYHFELLNIGYAAYLTFFARAKELFPDINDQQIARMVGGLQVDLYRPDDELRRLAQKAIDLGVDGEILGTESPEELFTGLRASQNGGGEWLDDYEDTADKWFLVSTAPGHPGGYHTYGTWQDEPAIPLTSLRDFITRLGAGEDISRPTDQVLVDRDKIANGFADLLDGAEREEFLEMVDLARKVFVYIEEHVVYIEHWMWSTFWKKSHELSAALVGMGVFEDPEDMFFLNRHEVAQLLYDVVAGWSVGTKARGGDFWGPKVAERRGIYETLKAWSPPPAYGTPPAEVTEPFTVMLWGITSDTVANWLDDGSGDGKLLKGAAASPGTVEGTARIVREAADLASVEEGEIMVCPATSPAWASVFPKLAAAVSDVGGMMSHTAIVCREYGLPAVVGTGHAVSTIKTGQRIKVDGSAGTVTLLD